MKNYGQEGYIYHVYGHDKYLKHALASASTVRRHDQKRMIGLVCEQTHADLLHNLGLADMFDVVYPLDPVHRSITGFKHNVYQYQLFDRSLFLDSDIIWCRNPDPLWEQLSSHGFTITGNIKADIFFGAAKGPAVLLDVLFRKRERTLKRFGLTYLSRVQSGLMYSSDTGISEEVCRLAGEMISRKDETHFQSRSKELGRSLESCEWSLAMAMSALNIPVFPWLQGHNSPQLDYIEDQCMHDPNFEDVICRYYTNHFTYSLRGLRNNKLRRTLIRIITTIPGYGDSMMVKPFCIHFGWLHQKVPFYQFSERIWDKAIHAAEAS